MKSMFCKEIYMLCNIMSHLVHDSPLDAVRVHEELHQPGQLARVSRHVLELQRHDDALELYGHGPLGALQHAGYVCEGRLGHVLSVDLQKNVAAQS